MYSKLEDGSPREELKRKSKLKNYKFMQRYWFTFLFFSFLLLVNLNATVGTWNIDHSCMYQTNNWTTCHPLILSFSQNHVTCNSFTILNYQLLLIFILLLLECLVYVINFYIISQIGNLLMPWMALIVFTTIVALAFVWIVLK